MNKKNPRFFFPCIALLICAVLGFAQTGGTISGRVTDATGALAPDVTVTATQLDTGLSRSVKSDSGGLYVIPELPVGNWAVKFTKDGFATFVQRSVLLQVNMSVEVNGSLDVAGAAAKVNVSA